MFIFNKNINMRNCFPKKDAYWLPKLRRLSHKGFQGFVVPTGFQNGNFVLATRKFPDLKTYSQ